MFVFVENKKKRAVHAMSLSKYRVLFLWITSGYIRIIWIYDFQRKAINGPKNHLKNNILTNIYFSYNKNLVKKNNSICY